MSINYASLAKTATRLIKENGRAMLLRSVATGEVFDPITGTITPGGPAVDTPFNGVMLSPDDKFVKTVGSESVEIRDMVIYMEPSVAVPIIGDTVVIDSVVWTIVRVQPVNPAGTPVLYVLQVRP